MGAEAMTPAEFLALDAPTAAQALRAIGSAETIVDINRIARHPVWPLLCLEAPEVLVRWHGKRANERRLHGQRIRESQMSWRKWRKVVRVTGERNRRDCHREAGRHDLASHLASMLALYGEGYFERPLTNRRKPWQCFNLKRVAWEAQTFAPLDPLVVTRPRVKG